MVLADGGLFRGFPLQENDEEDNMEQDKDEIVAEEVDHSDDSEEASSESDGDCAIKTSLQPSRPRHEARHEALGSRKDAANLDFHPRKRMRLGGAHCNFGIVVGINVDLESFAQYAASYLDKKSLGRFRKVASSYTGLLHNIVTDALFKELLSPEGFARPPYLARQRPHAKYFKRIWGCLASLAKASGAGRTKISDLVSGATWLRSSCISGWGDCGKEWKKVSTAAFEAMIHLLPYDGVIPVTAELLKDIGEQDDPWEHFLVQWFVELMLEHRTAATPMFNLIFVERSSRNSQQNRRILYKALCSRRVREDGAHIDVLMAKSKLHGMSRRDARILTQGSTSISPNHPGGALALVPFIRDEDCVQKWFEAAWASMEKTRRLELTKALQALAQSEGSFEAQALLALAALARGRIHCLVASGSFAALSQIIVADE